MALKIRLTRGGSKRDPHYSIVVTEARTKRDGSNFNAKLGHYHPRLPKDNENRVVLDQEGVLKWIKNGAIPTDVVVRLMKQKGMEIAAKYEKPYVVSERANMSKKEYAALLKKQAEDAKVAAAEKKKKQEEDAKAAEEAKAAAAESSSSESEAAAS